MGIDPVGILPRQCPEEVLEPEPGSEAGPDSRSRAFQPGMSMSKEMPNQCLLARLAAWHMGSATCWQQNMALKLTQQQQAKAMQQVPVRQNDGHCVAILLVIPAPVPHNAGSVRLLPSL